MESAWEWEDGCLVFSVKADRFLRGMVRALVATMLKIGRGKMTIAELKNVIDEKDCSKASFAAPSQGLFLVRVNYPKNYFE
jgi:tRNA pseudouridine38-40 synthase